MENNNNIRTTEFLESNPVNDLVQKEKSVGGAVALLAIAIVLIALAATPVIANSYLAMTMVFGGIAVLIAGIILFCSAKGKNKYVYIYQPTNETLKLKNTYIDNDAARAIKSGDFAALDTLKPAAISSHCLETYGTASGRFFVAQLLHYENYQFNSETEVITVSDENAALLHQFINQK